MLGGVHEEMASSNRAAARGGSKAGVSNFVRGGSTASTLRRKPMQRQRSDPSIRGSLAMLVEANLYTRRDTFKKYTSNWIEGNPDHYGTQSYQEDDFPRETTDFDDPAELLRRQDQAEINQGHLDWLRARDMRAELVEQPWQARQAAHGDSEARYKEQTRAGGGSGAVIDEPDEGVDLINGPNVGRTASEGSAARVPPLQLEAGRSRAPVPLVNPPSITPVDRDVWLRVSPVPLGSALPAVPRAEQTQETICWRAEFVRKAVSLSVAMRIENPILTVASVRQAARKRPAVLEGLRGRSEVVGSDGRRELWSAAFLGYLEALSGSKSGPVVRQTLQQLPPEVVFPQVGPLFASTVRRLPKKASLPAPSGFKDWVQQERQAPFLPAVPERLPYQTAYNLGAPWTRVQQPHNDPLRWQAQLRRQMHEEGYAGYTHGDTAQGYAAYTFGQFDHDRRYGDDHTADWDPEPYDPYNDENGSAFDQSDYERALSPDSPADLDGTDYYPVSEQPEIMHDTSYPFMGEVPSRKQDSLQEPPVGAVASYPFMEMEHEQDVTAKPASSEDSGFGGAQADSTKDSREPNWTVFKSLRKSVHFE